MDTQEVLKVKEAADLLRCSTTWLYREAASGRLPSYRLGTDLRFIRDDLLSWLRSQTSPPPREAASTTSQPELPLAPVQVQEAGQDDVQSQDQEAGTPELGHYFDPRLKLEPPLAPIGKGPRLTPEERLERQVWVVTAVRRGSTLAAAATLAGLARRTLTLWTKQYPDFDRALTEASRLR